MSAFPVLHHHLLFLRPRLHLSLRPFSPRLRRPVFFSAASVQCSSASSSSSSTASRGEPSHPLCHTLTDLLHQSHSLLIQTTSMRLRSRQASRRRLVPGGKRNSSLMLTLQGERGISLRRT
ncbi:hypothetical protein BHM03_00019087 [Ensete ventricosum]|nr:hypothetical protein BHM03_00019087 [Ensete ventricosum]